MQPTKTRTLAPPAAERAPESTGRHLDANRETVEKVFEKLKRGQDKLASEFNEQIRERRESPFLGEIVLYRMPEGPGVGDQRAAIVALVLDGEGNSTRCALKVICVPDLDGTGVMDEPNVAYGPGLGEWLPNDPRIPLKDPGLEDRVAVGAGLDG